MGLGLGWVCVWLMGTEYGELEVCACGIKWGRLGV